MIPSLCFAGGPKYQHKDPLIQDEFVQAYHDIRFPAVVPGQISGTTTNDNAAAGKVGEYIESLKTLTDFPASTVFGDFTSISLTPGDWDVSALAQMVSNAATMTSSFIAISPVSGNDSAQLANGVNLMDFPVVNANGSASVPVYRVSLAVTTTIYMKYFAIYTGGPPRARGRLSARRVR